jgi:superfamily I DNA and/or RNA helicase
LFLEQGPDFENLVRAIIRENPGEKTADAWTAFLDAVWTRFWIKKIENSFPVLKEVHSPSWAEEIHFLQNQIQEKARLTAGILQLRLSENSYKNLEYNRLNNRVSYRELFHQVSKKRMKKPLRVLWQSHSEEIKKLIPAWLATPESVSATWDMHTRFDLVIFDESSQCFAEKGLPAAYRGDTLVVVGDSKQLQPNKHFMSRWEDGDEEDAVSGQVSLLDLACQFLPQNTLRGHYRSEYPELIAFSNLHFYQNKLEFLPHAWALKNRVPAIRWMQTHGIWKDQQNDAEALAIAESIFDFASSRLGESIGIITFNIRQQMLIEQYAEALSLEKQQPLPPSLFIKNIENVQGDECDHLWFSIAYAQGENGKINYQFGSLSQSGGENRLNVAITRARKSITLFCSILPEQFDPGENAPPGPKLLKQFLHYARDVNRQGPVGMGSMAFAEKNWWQELQEVSGEMDENHEPTLQLTDGALFYKSISCKDYFGYKPLIFKDKGYSVSFTFSRPQKPVA